MRITSETFWLPKTGSTIAEYEDAAWPTESLSKVFETFRAAVADGATEASFSGLWAGLLVEAYKDGKFDEDAFDANVTDLQRRWTARVGETPLPWYAEQKLESGAFAALVGLTLGDIGDDGTGKWTAIAIGDSCLFHLRGGEVISKFPIQKSEDFNSRPALMSSSPKNNEGFMDRLRRDSGVHGLGEQFFIMSDALACWFLKRWELKSDPLELLGAINTQGEFASFIAEQRADLVDGEAMLKNDDMTFVRIKIMAHR